MGKVQHFEISLRESRVIYGPGEPLSGTVTLRLTAPLQYRAIKVSCVGSCGVSNKVNETSWAVEEQYFNSTLSLADKGTLPAGEHSLPFQFLLPVSAPTSFEGPFGKVTHQVRAVIDTPRFSKDYKCNKIFYILSPLNLNDITDIESPGRRGFCLETRRLRMLADSNSRWHEWRKQDDVECLPMLSGTFTKEIFAAAHAVGRHHLSIECEEATD